MRPGASAACPPSASRPPCRPRRFAARQRRLGLLSADAGAIGLTRPDCSARAPGTGGLRMGSASRTPTLIV
eukprot:4101681-Prymnesium_polylepis.1